MPETDELRPFFAKYPGTTPTYTVFTAIIIVVATEKNTNIGIKPMKDVRYNTTKAIVPAINRKMEQRTSSPITLRTAAAMLMPIILNIGINAVLTMANVVPTANFSPIKLGIQAVIPSFSMPCIINTKHIKTMPEPKTNSPKGAFSIAFSFPSPVCSATSISTRVSLGSSIPVPIHQPTAVSITTKNEPRKTCFQSPVSSKINAVNPYVAKVPTGTVLLI